MLLSPGVCSITGPWYDGPCPHPSCTEPNGCPGNHLSFIGGDRQALHLHLQHLKTSRWASFVPVSIDLPPTLNTIFAALTGGVRRALMTVWPDHPYLFFNPMTGQALKPQEVSCQFRKAFPEGLQAMIPSPRACRCGDSFDRLGAGCVSHVASNTLMFNCCSLLQ